MKKLSKSALALLLAKGSVGRFLRTQTEARAQRGQAHCGLIGIAGFVAVAVAPTTATATGTRRLVVRGKVKGEQVLDGGAGGVAQAWWAVVVVRRGQEILAAAVVALAAVDDGGGKEKGL